MTTRAILTQPQIERMIKAAQNCGLPVYGLYQDSDGCGVVTHEDLKKTVKLKENKFDGIREPRA